MSRDSGVKRAALWVGLGATATLGMLLLGIARGRVQAGEKPDAPARSVAEARALVASLEAQLRDTELRLKDAKDSLGRLERGEKPAPEADEKEAAVPEGGGTGLIEGVWRIVGIDGNKDGNFKEPPYDEFKIVSAGHYLWISFELGTGKVLRSGGGTCSVKDGVYAATIECSNSADLRAIVGKKYVGTCRVEGKKWFHAGKVPNGAVFDELWERLN